MQLLSTLAQLCKLTALPRQDQKALPGYPAGMPGYTPEAPCRGGAEGTPVPSAGVCPISKQALWLDVSMETLISLWVFCRCHKPLPCSQG